MASKSLSTPTSDRPCLGGDHHLGGEEIPPQQSAKIKNIAISLIALSAVLIAIGGGITAILLRHRFASVTMLTGVSTAVGVVGVAGLTVLGLGTYKLASKEEEPLKKQVSDDEEGDWNSYVVPPESTLPARGNVVVAPPDCPPECIVSRDGGFPTGSDSIGFNVDSNTALAPVDSEVPTIPRDRGDTRERVFLPGGVVLTAESVAAKPTGHECEPNGDDVPHQYVL